MKAIKWIVLGVAGLVMLLVIAVFITALVVDPNRFKPRIEQLAEDQGIELDIAGDLEWRFFPMLAIGVGSTRAQGDDLPNITFNQASLQLAWAPLLRQEVAFKGVMIDGLHLDLGASSTSEDAVTAGGSVPLVLGTEQDMGGGIRLAIENIRLTNSQIGYRGASGVQEYIRDIHLQAEGFNTEAKPFPIRLSMTLPEDMAGTPVRLDIESRATIQDDFSQFNLDKASFAATGLEPQETWLRDLEATFDADLDTAADRAVLSNLRLGMQGIQVMGHLEVEHFSTTPRASGNLSTGEFDPRPLLDSFDIELDQLPTTVLRKVSVAADFSASPERVSLRDLSLRVDDMDVTASLDAGLEPRSLDLTISGSQIDLRQYISSSSEEDSIPAEEALLAPAAGALLWLDGGRGNINVSLERIITEVVTLEQPRLRLGANDHVLAINQISAGAWGGQLNLGGSLDFNHPAPALAVQMEVNGVDLQQALLQLGDYDDLSGRFSLQFAGRTSGESAETLQRNLIGEGSFQLEQPYFSEFNVERAYCELAALVEQSALTQQPWATGTQFNDFQGSFHVAGPRITLNEYQSGIGNLDVKGRGRVNLEEQSYEILVNANLQAETTSAQGCEVRSTRIRNRDIPIQCRGSFSDSASCRPDEQFVQQLVRGQLENLLRDHLRDNRNEENSEEATDQVQEEDDDPVRSLLRGVLGR